MEQLNYIIYNYYQCRNIIVLLCLSLSIHLAFCLECSLNSAVNFTREYGDRHFAHIRVRCINISPHYSQLRSNYTVAIHIMSVSKMFPSFFLCLSLVNGA